MKINQKIILLSLLSVLACRGNLSKQPVEVPSTVFLDGVKAIQIQEIPGRLDFEFYDLGGEGVAYHDSDSVNSGSGQLNPIDGSYLHGFRAQEAVDISFTKGDNIDNSGFNFDEPELESLDLGWTNPGEWLNYTINVKESGVYSLDLWYTANRDASIYFSVKAEAVSDTILIENTFVDADTIQWRNWHHWKFKEEIGEISLNKGIQTLRLHIAEHGNFNLDYMNISRKENADSNP